MAAAFVVSLTAVLNTCILPSYAPVRCSSKLSQFHTTGRTPSHYPRTEEMVARTVSHFNITHMAVLFIINRWEIARKLCYVSFHAGLYLM